MSAVDEIEKLIAKAKDQASGAITNERLKDRVLWIIVLTIPLLIVMHKFGFDAVILDRVFDVVVLGGIIFGVRGCVRDIMNGLIAISKNKALASEGKLDAENAEQNLDDTHDEAQE